MQQAVELEAQVTSQGGDQYHYQDDHAGHDHDLLLQGGEEEKKRERVSTDRRALEKKENIQWDPDYPTISDEAFWSSPASPKKKWKIQNHSKG